MIPQIGQHCDYRLGEEEEGVLAGVVMVVSVGGTCLSGDPRVAVWERGREEEGEKERGKRREKVRGKKGK